jgi:hypothetical protein
MTEDIRQTAQDLLQAISDHDPYIKTDERIVLEYCQMVLDAAMVRERTAMSTQILGRVRGVNRG